MTQPMFDPTYWSLQWFHRPPGAEEARQFSSAIVAYSATDAHRRGVAIKASLRVGDKVMSKNELPDLLRINDLRTVNGWEIYACHYQHAGDNCRIYVYAKNPSHLVEVVLCIRETGNIGDQVVQVVKGPPKKDY